MTLDGRLSSVSSKLIFTTGTGKLLRSATLLLALVGLFAPQRLSGQETARPSKPPVRKQAVAFKTPATKETPWQEAYVQNSKAPVKVVEFFDYQCPFCAKTIPALDEVLQAYPGKVQLILKHTPLSIHPDSLLAHQAALAAGEQEKFWEMSALLFAHQRNVRLPDLIQYARQLNLDVAQFEQQLKTRYFEAAVRRDMALAEGLGVSATPTFFVNGKRLVGAQTPAQLQETIDAVLDPATKRARNTASRPDQLGISAKDLDLSHAPALGPPGAPVIIVEFSDLQCPFCAHVAPVIQDLRRLYPDQVRVVFKNFPLSFHSDAQLAHQAVLAAGLQGKFWEMHDSVFAKQSSIKKPDLLAHARELQLDLDKFASDMESEQVKQWIAADEKEGRQLEVNGTPTFFVNGTEYSGAMTLEQFQAILQKQLSPGRVSAAAGDDSITAGPQNAPITLLWFSDLQSSLAVKATLMVRRLVDRHPGKIRLVFKNDPLTIHPQAMLLHEAALAANAQGKFWQMHDVIVADPQKNSRKDLDAYATRIGLDITRFESDLDSHKFLPAIERDLREATRLSATGTPVFFLNSARVDGLQEEKVFEDIIAAQLAATGSATARQGSGSK